MYRQNTKKGTVKIINFFLNLCGQCHTHTHNIKKRLVVRLIFSNINLGGQVYLINIKTNRTEVIKIL